MLKRHAINQDWRQGSGVFVESQFVEWGREALRRIEADLALPRRNLYCEMVFLDAREDYGVAAAWPCSLQIMALGRGGAN